MPRAYLTLEEKARAELNKFNRRQDNELRAVLLTAKKTKKLTYKSLAEKADVGESTARKALDVSLDLGTIELDKLRKVCNALGVRLQLFAE